MQSKYRYGRRALRLALVVLLAVGLVTSCGGKKTPRATKPRTAVPNSGVTSGPIPCDLNLRFGSRSESPPGQFHINLVVVNADDTNTICRVSGYPNVELIGPAYPTFGTIYSLPQSYGHTESVTLRDGESAHAVLTWLPSSLDLRTQWVPAYVRVVVPTNAGPSFAMALPWRYGSVERQDGATHPGTYVGPIGRGAE